MPDGLIAARAPHPVGRAALLLGLCVALAGCDPTAGETGQPQASAPGTPRADFATLLCRNDPLACRPLVLPVTSLTDARAEPPPAPLPAFVPALPVPRRPSRIPALILGDDARTVAD